MKYAVKLLALTLLFPLLFSCEKEEEAKGPEELILGVWKRDLLLVVEEEEEEYDFERLSFYSDGIGVRRLWKWIDSSDDFAMSDYEMVFTWRLNGENLQLDYGFGYIHNYRNVRVTEEYLTMYWKNYPERIYSRIDHNDHNDRNILGDIAMEIIGEWSMTDPENGASYRINFRTDGSYEAHCRRGGSGSELVEQGSYQVHNSRVRFNSTASGSMLNGRIFLITSLGTKAMDLRTENETPFTAYKVN